MSSPEMGIRSAIFALSFVYASFSGAMAEEQMRIQTTSGAWAAMVHQPSMLAPADVCLAVQIEAGLAFRAGSDGAQLRIINRSWSLPPHITGNINVKVGDYAKAYEIDYNEDTMVSVDIGFIPLIVLMNEMDKASSMVVIVGKGAPMNVSLDGSTKVTNAFRTCARLGSSGKKGEPGANPFE